MHTRWFRLLPLFIAALWLPLQAVAAIAMPFCRHGETQKVAVAADQAVVHCHQHERQQTPADHVANACDQCGFCHLAGAGFMPAAEPVAAVIPAGRDFRSDAPLAPASNIPEPPRQPPRRLA